MTIRVMSFIVRLVVGHARLGRIGLGVCLDNHLRAARILGAVARKASDDSSMRITRKMRELAEARNVAENLAGHITWQREGDENLLVNPWGIWWAETRASDILTIRLPSSSG